MPTTIERHKASLHQPAFSELLPVRDILNDVIIRTTGALVAGYELSGINSYYHNDDGRNRAYAQVVCSAKDVAAFEKLGFGEEEYWKGLPEGVSFLVNQEANYGNASSLRDLAERASGCSPATRKASS